MGLGRHFQSYMIIRYFCLPKALPMSSYCEIWEFRAIPCFERIEETSRGSENRYQPHFTAQYHFSNAGEKEKTSFVDIIPYDLRHYNGSKYTGIGVHKPLAAHHLCSSLSVPPLSTPTLQNISCIMLMLMIIPIAFRTPQEIQRENKPVHPCLLCS